MDERWDWVDLEEIFESYIYSLESTLSLFFDKISKYLIIKFKYFNNLLVNFYEVYFVLLFLSKNSILNYKCGIDFTAIDFYYKTRRFKLVYILLNLLSNKRLDVISYSYNNNFISSVSSIYKSFNWSEREVWDLFGIFFINNCGLRRILNDYGFKGYPLRKDFPLTGFIELYFNNNILDVCYRPVQLSQELRFFNFSSCWDDNSSNI